AGSIANKDAEASDMDGALFADAGSGSDGGVELHLERVLEMGPWVGGQLAPAMAGDTLERVYVASSEAIFRIDGTAMDTYMTRDDGAAIVGRGRDQFGFEDVDVDANGLLYVLTTGEVLTSTSPHVGSIHRSGIVDLQKLGVVSPNLLVVLGGSIGLWS